MPGLPECAVRLPRGRSLRLGGTASRPEPVLMGIVNVTPDSFYEGSRRTEVQSAIETALRMVSDGAAIIDFGAESTRPGSAEVDPEEEIARLLPVISGFRARSEAVISVDTRHPQTAAAALDAGADIINDIEALRRPGMARLAASYGAGVVLMHMQGTPQTMQISPSYDHCLEEVVSFLKEAALRAIEAGIPPESIILDPGIGFGKNLDHNLELLRGIPTIKTLGYPVLIGLSRKRMIGDLTGQPIELRLPGSIAGALAAWVNGADILRVHDVRETRDALRVFGAAWDAQQPWGAAQ